MFNVQFFAFIVSAQIANFFEQHYFLRYSIKKPLNITIFEVVRETNIICC